MRLIFYLPMIFFSNINVIPFKIVPLGSYTPMETLFPLLVAALGSLQPAWSLTCPLHCQLSFFFYKYVLKRLRKRVIRVRPDIADKWMLHNDNAPYHNTLSVTGFLTSKDIPVVPQPPVPMTFSFFPNLKISSKDVISGL